MAMENKDNDSDIEDNLEDELNEDDQPEEIMDTITRYTDLHQFSEDHLREAPPIINEQLVWWNSELALPNNSINRTNQITTWITDYNNLLTVIQNRIIFLQQQQENSDNTDDTNDTVD